MKRYMVIEHFAPGAEHEVYESGIVAYRACRTVAT